MAGRGAPKGNTNRKGKGFKATIEVLETLKRYNCDPIANLCEISAVAKEMGDLTLAFNCNKELAQYVAPKRKAVEHTGQDGNPIETLSEIVIKFE